MDHLDKPNLSFPLANTYNERGIAGYTQTVTGGKDQRKVNCWYEQSYNPATGTQTQRIAKRPGVAATAALFTSAVSSHAAHNIYPYADSGSATPWLFTTFSNSTFAADLTSVNFITAITPGLKVPTYVDAMPISGVNTVFLQTYNALNGVTTAHYASSISSWTTIGSPVASVVGKLIPMDGYVFGLTTTNSVINSNLNDPSTWGALSYITKQIQQDSPVGLMRLGKRIISAGKETIEQFVNVGNAAGSPLEVVPSGFQRVGLNKGSYAIATTKSYYAEMAGRIFFCGQAANASAGSSAFTASAQGGIYAFDGNAMEKVSTPFIDKIIMENGFLSIQPLSIMGRNGLSVGLNTTSALLFFPEWKEWFEWTNNNVFQFVSGGGYYISAPAIGTSHNTYRFASNTDRWQDNSIDYTMTVQFKLPTKGNDHQRLLWCGVKGDTAASTTTSTLNISLSRDDWQTFEAARTIDMTKPKKHIYRCGSFTDLGVQLTHTGNLDCRLEQFLARIG